MTRRSFFLCRFRLLLPYRYKKLGQSDLCNFHTETKIFYRLRNLHRTPPATCHHRAWDAWREVRKQLAPLALQDLWRWQNSQRRHSALRPAAELARLAVAAAVQVMPAPM